jgi:hypothetical protein
MAGNEVHARFDHPNGLTSYFDSLADEETDGQAFGLQIVGSRGVVDIKLDRDPLAYLLPGNPWAAKTGGSSWLSITSAGVNKPETDPRIPRLIERHDISALDLINAIHADRAPLCDVSEAAMTIEMIHGVLASHTRAGQSVEIPLNHRSHPLKSWTA